LWGGGKKKTGEKRNPVGSLGAVPLGSKERTVVSGDKDIPDHKPRWTGGESEIGCKEPSIRLSLGWIEEASKRGDGAIVESVTNRYHERDKVKPSPAIVCRKKGGGMGKRGENRPGKDAEKNSSNIESGKRRSHNTNFFIIGKVLSITVKGRGGETLERGKKSPNQKAKMGLPNVLG